MSRASCRRLLLPALLAMSCAGRTDVPRSMRGWNEPVAPFRVAGNIHHVGTNRMALFLLTTPAGHILINSGFHKNVPNLKRNIESLGFRFEDIKILLASHAHIDHVQGHALVRQMTGARVLVSEPDAPVVAAGGGKTDWAYGDVWPPCPVDAPIKDGERVELGGTVLTAHLTPGHTKGATTWTTTVVEDGRPLAVVFYPSGNVPPGARLHDNAGYPQIAEDFRRSFATWKALPCDVFLGAHGDFFDLPGKVGRRAAGPPSAPNPFIDPEGYRRTIAETEARFLALAGN